MTITGRGTASRIGGRGRLLFSLRALLKRVEKFAEHRARDASERAWGAKFYDSLWRAFESGVADPGAATGLHAVDVRRSQTRKGRRV